MKQVLGEDKPSGYLQNSKYRKVRPVCTWAKEWYKDEPAWLRNLAMGKGKRRVDEEQYLWVTEKICNTWA